MLRDIRKVVGEADYTPSDPQELCNRVLTTCYMATTNSSEDTRHRAESLAHQIGRLVTII